MTRLSTQFFIMLILTGLVSCFPDDYDRCGDGYRFERNECIEIKDESNTGSEDDAGLHNANIRPEKWIGSACRCEGEGCSLAGVPIANAGSFIGCEDLPDDWPGAVPGCMRSYTGELSVPYYYANGFCILMSLYCTGDKIVCDPMTEETGDFHAMTTCPEDTVLVQKHWAVTASGLNAEFEQKMCAPVCREDSDCRVDEYDEVFDEPGQYQCLDRDGIRFCFDPRNLSEDDTVEAS